MATCGINSPFGELSPTCRQNQNQAVKKLCSTDYSALPGDDKADGIGKVISATIEISARENYRPPRPLMSCGIVRIPNLRSSSTAFLIFGEIFREENNLT